jgi:translation initiation factor IF-2
MKTLTEISGSVIRTAAAAVAAAQRTSEPEERPTVPAVVVAKPGDAPAAGEAAPTAEGAAAAEPAPAPAAAAKPEREAETPEQKAALDEAVAKATGLSGDRLAMVRAAVTLVGRRAEDVRLVRVFAADEQLSGAQKAGEHQYLVDYFPQSMRQVAGGRRDEGRGGRGRGGGGRGGGGGGRGGGGGGGGSKGATTGGFSMDSLREDRKNERGGRRPGGPGGGRGGPRGPAK